MLAVIYYYCERPVYGDSEATKRGGAMPAGVQGEAEKLTQGAPAVQHER